MKTITKLLWTLLILVSIYANGQTDLHFNGTGYVLINLPDASDFYVGGGDFTWQCWVKTTDLGAFKTITGSYTSSGAKFFFGVSLGYVIAAPGNQTTANSTTFVADGNWHFITATRQSGQLIVYVNGVAEDTVTNTASITSSNGLAIGRYEAAGLELIGEVDMLSYWSDARTPGEIQMDMIQCTYAGNEPNLIAYFPFDEGAGDTTSDITTSYQAVFMAGLDTVDNAWDTGVSIFAAGVDIRTECAPYIWIDGNIYTSNNNTATHNIVGGATNGCDSVVTLNLTINQPSTGTDVISACGPYTWIDGNTYTSNNNTATYTLTNSVGCDSVVTLNLTSLSVQVSIKDEFCPDATDGSIIASAIEGQAPHTYMWSNASTNSTISSLGIGTYCVTVTDANSCEVDTCITIGITYNSCDYVWPGDCDFDGNVHWTDLFLVGRYYKTKGPVRPDTGSIWKPYGSDDWGVLTTDSNDLKHVDGNGDGVINWKDGELVERNYFQTHAKSGQSRQNNASNPDLYFDVLSNDIAPGTTVEIAIVVGRDTSTTIYGIGFEIDFDRTLIAPNSLNLDFENGIMGRDTSYISIVIGRDTSAGKMIAAITRTDSVNIFDFGILAKLTFTIDSNATPGEELGLQITNSGGTVINGDTTDYFHPPGEADTNLTIGEPKGLPETFNYSRFKLYPNPTDNSVSFELPNDMLGSRYEFLNNIGQVVLSGKLTSKSVDVSQLQQGLYHVKIYSTNGTYYQELEILR